MSEVLVLGGTGAIGLNLVRHLEQSEHVTTVTSRQIRENSPRIKFVQGNAREPYFLNEILSKRWDVIVDFMVHETESFARSISTILGSADKYIFLSSARVFSESKYPLIESSSRLLEATLDKKFLKSNEYALKKARQENLLLDSKFRNWIIVRPYITYDNNRLQLGGFEKEEWLYRALNGRKILFSEDLCNVRTTMTSAGDVARALMAIIEQEGVSQEIYNVTQNRIILWGQVLKIYVDACSKFLDREIGVQYLSVEELLKCKNGVYQMYYDRLYDREFDNTKLSGLLDTEGFVRAEHGLTNAVENFLKAPKFLDINWKYQAVMDRFSGELAKKHEFDKMSSRARYFLNRIPRVG